MAPIYKRFKGRVKPIYNYYCQQHHHKLGNKSEHKMFSREFALFVKDFEITPVFMNLRTSEGIYAVLTRDKPIIDKVPIGME